MQSFNFFVVLIVRIFSKKTIILEQNLTTCSGPVKMSIRTTYIKLKKLLDKLDSFGIEYTNDQTLSKR